MDSVLAIYNGDLCRLYHIYEDKAVIEIETKTEGGKTRNRFEIVSVLDVEIIQHEVKKLSEIKRFLIEQKLYSDKIKH